MTGTDATPSERRASARTEIVVALVSGVIFAVGLGLAGMTRPTKVIGFLDMFSGHWDPSLALVMAAAIGVHMPLYRLIRRRAQAIPMVGTCGPLDTGLGPTRPPSVDRRLIGGAAVFGVGWGLSGYCPGPVVVSLVTVAPGVLIFVAAMLLGMWLVPADRALGDDPSRSRKTDRGFSSRIATE